MNTIHENTKPRAEAVEYHPEDESIYLTLESGLVLPVPLNELSYLSGASSEEIAQVEITDSGECLEWDSLDVHYYIPGLVLRLVGLGRKKAQVALAA